VLVSDFVLLIDADKEIKMSDNPENPRPDDEKILLQTEELGQREESLDEDRGAMADDQDQNGSPVIKTESVDPVRANAGSNKPVEAEYPEVELSKAFRFWAQDASTWNSWRNENPGKIKLNDQGRAVLLKLKSLSDFNFSNMDLSNYDFSNKEAIGADFSNALLKGANLTGTDLRRANLTEALMVDARLSGAVIDEETVFDRLKPAENVTIGINGIYVRRKSREFGEEVESAALMTLVPAGDSMKGHSSEAVLENLKHARQLHTASILLVTIVTVILIFPKKEGLKMPVLDLELSVGYIAIISQIISIVYQFLVLNHIRDAADGAKYLRTREDAMKIAMFPWGISNYPGVNPVITWRPRELLASFDKWWPWFSSELNRAVTSFHSMLFLLGGLIYFSRFWWKYNPFAIDQLNKETLALYLKPVTFLLCSALLLVFSRLIYKEARRFIRPIVFDAQAEKSPKSELAGLAASVEEQLQVTKRLASLIETAIPRYPNLVDRFYDRLPGGVEIGMLLIPAGEFDMGPEKKENEKSDHHVTLREFWMSETQVTQRLWTAVMGRLPDLLTKKEYINPLYPVVFVSWNDANDFCRHLNDKLGLTEQYGYRLPTEAEWEYAARAGTKTIFSFSDDEKELENYGWFNGNSGGHPQVVGQKLPNPFGLYDMHGNVWEWCQDQYQDKYDGAPRDGSAREDGGMAALRVFRGGSWYGNAVHCRSANRFWYAPGYRLDDLGFRLSRTLP
jgi:formylglycine-generating enzyme required for sulfatase activity